jgi:hypothetical protein
MPADGFFIHAEERGDFVMAKAREETEFHDLGFFGVLGGQNIQSFVYLQNLLILNGSFDGGLMQFDALGSAAAFEAQFAAGIFDENAAHGFGSGSEEVTAIFPLRLLIGTEPEPRFMDQSSGLKRLPRGFAAQLGGSDTAQFTIYE